MAAPQIPMVTVEEYLDFDRNSPVKNEFYRGRIIAMAGGTYNHGAIGANAIRELGLALKGKRTCQVVTSDVRLAADLDSHFTYPDTMVVCGKPAYVGQRRDTVRNPVVVVEVLSPSTERADRGRKFDAYCQIGSVREYLILSQFEPRAELYRREPDNVWKLHRASGMDATVTLESLNVELKLADLYENIEFEPEDL